MKKAINSLSREIANQSAKIKFICDLKRIYTSEFKRYVLHSRANLLLSEKSSS